MLKISLMSASLEGRPRDLQSMCKYDLRICIRLQTPEAAIEVGEVIYVLWGISSLTAMAVTPYIARKRLVQ
jgi:hypothetical protein